MTAFSYASSDCALTTCSLKSLARQMQTTCYPEKSDRPLGVQGSFPEKQRRIEFRV